MRTLRQCSMILEFVKHKGVDVKFHGRGKNEASHYCGQCEVSKSQSRSVKQIPKLTDVNKCEN